MGHKGPDSEHTREQRRHGRGQAQASTASGAGDGGRGPCPCTPPTNQGHCPSTLPSARVGLPRRLHIGTVAVGCLVALLAVLDQSLAQVIASQRTVLDLLKAALPPTSACSTVWSYTCGARKLCDANKYIVNLKLDGCGFSGSFPSDISGLSTLTALTGSNNQFSAVPSTLSVLTKLVTFRLDNNSLAGAVPPAAVSLPRIAELWLSGNQLTGGLPTSLPTTLTFLDLSRNLLTGGLPSGWSTLLGLNSLQLQNNQLSGALPSAWGRTPVITLKLSNNKLTSISGISSFTRIQNFYADNNLITSLPDLPPSITNVFLYNNQIQGPIPNSWSNLQSINYLHLQGNKITGQVPSFPSSSSLVELNVGGNYLSGAVPDSFCNFDFALVLGDNCLSYSPAFSCPSAQAMKASDSCRAFCGDSCVPVLPGVDLTSAPLGGCLDCSSQRIAYVFSDNQGVSYQDAENLPSVRGSPSRNIQKYLTVGPPSGSTGSIVATSSATDWVSCCAACAGQTGCSYWHFYPPENGPVPASQGGTPSTFCYLLSVEPPKALLPAVQLVETSLPVSHVGGHCNPAAQVVDDPHFTGARGTRFDFTGELGRSFCLLSDEALHINVLLRGYLDPRLEEATKIVHGKAVRSWIKEMAVLWRSPSGSPTSIQFAARGGVVPDSSPQSFLKSVSANGIPARLPKVGQEVLLSKGIRLLFRSTMQKHRSYVALYELSLGSDTVIGVRLRPAHVKLRTSTDSEVHINLHLLKIKVTSRIHGILGQTFRDDKDRLRRAKLFSDVAKALKGPVVVDGASGKGFLDGKPMDYATSRLTAPDCVFAHEAWTPRSHQRAGPVMKQRLSPQGQASKAANSTATL